MEENNNNNSKNIDNNFKALMKSPLQHNALEDDEDFSPEFQCCVCLELLYKPVVLACGHISCFWCVFNAMNIWHESNCPVCRHPYNHFPSICQLLHFLLMKLYPAIYKKRERQVTEEEKKSGQFSPEVEYHIFRSQTSKDVDSVCNSLHFPSQEQTKLYSESYSSREGKSSSCMQSFETAVECGDDTTLKSATSSESSEATANSTIQECSLTVNDLEYKAHNQFSVDDLPCAACKRMLFQPVVLNCGHVYCESCIVVPRDGNFRCPICQSLHPHGLPSVCLILEHFLEEQFSDLYAERRKALRIQTNGSTQAQRHAHRSASFPKNVYSSWWVGNGPKVHVGVGCDFCGMSPIIGERYKCKDCTERIGFDLCEACYNNPVKTPGRFNQQHKPEHKFEIMQPADINDLLYRMNAELSDDEGSDATENNDGVSRTPESSDAEDDSDEPSSDFAQ
ncbi:E3 ubiquitin-protein ligase PRT1-like [Melia azedarach]|uniref:E3 ubiquitin-protein ligase PRT1-like n=1 Tax=Melia azedarach TaxID=155640 RepID=A0ACC1YIN8_MELAZ|nr:E3 ubiquitin-protein ligase PRT1-like [Melia azedarach]